MIVTCMDARIDVWGLFARADGDAHMLRDASGVVTDDTIGSLAVSQLLLGTEEIVLVHHTECGLLNITDQQFADRLEELAGQPPTWSAEAFSDLDEDVRRSIARIETSPFVPSKVVRGFVYNVETGSLREVERG